MQMHAWLISFVPEKLTLGDTSISLDNLSTTGIYLCQSYTWNMQDLGEVRGEGPRTKPLEDPNRTPV